MAPRLLRERAEAASQVLAAIGLAALVLAENGRVLAANALAEKLTHILHWRTADRVTLQDEAADHQLQRSLAAVFSMQQSVRTFPVRGVEPRVIMVGHVLPVRLSARDILMRSHAVLVLTPVTTPDAPSVELMQSLFDLTPAEARVARDIASGKTVDQIASEGGLSANTVRSQVRGVLHKTGCARQTEVIALLGGLSIVGAERRGRGRA